VKRRLALFFLGLGLLPAAAKANFYNETCQTIRLHGRIELPAGYPEKRPLELTLAYQLNFQQHPTYLKVNLPLGATEYNLNIVGYRQRSEGDLYIPMMFWYPRSVKFQYYVKSRLGTWISPTKTTTYFPAVTKVEEEGDCQPDLYFETLALNKK